MGILRNRSTRWTTIRPRGLSPRSPPRSRESGGGVVARPAYEHGGWPAVDKLYAAPPQSTEQVLHPDTKLYPRRDPPTKVVLAKARGTELWGSVLGELQWKIYFDLWKRSEERRVG